MTDELTPEEKEALKKLPRERMPSAGLEERVVGALRERRILSKRPRRTVEITNSRVAGLLAACVALVIGAYSIGLHRGGGDQVLPSVATVDPRPDHRGTVEAPTTGAPETPITGAPETKTGRSASDETRNAELSAAATDAEKGDVTVPKEESPVEPRPAQATRSDEQTVLERARSLEEQEEGLAERRVEVPASQPQKAPPPQETLAPKAMTKESVRMAQPEPEGVAPLAQPKPTGEPPLVFGRTLSFLLNGTPVVVDAPDSVRITWDDLGQTIIIYTRDGPIRFRLADDD
jgi:hypothetical protein